MTDLLSFSEFHLNETLVTHDINLTLKDFKKNIPNIDITIDPNKNIIYVTLQDVNNMNSFFSILENINLFLLNRHGWFPSQMYITNLHGLNNLLKFDWDYITYVNECGVPRWKYFKDIKIKYESKYDVEVNCPKLLYHLSIQQYTNDISKRGLIPKSKNKKSKHLDRIYVCSQIKDCYNLIESMKTSLIGLYPPKTLKGINTKWIIYQLNIKDMKIKLFKDPNYKGGYYIVENIPPDKIITIDFEK